MTLDDEDTENGLQLVPGSHGMNVPSTCSIVIIAGKNFSIFSLLKMKAEVGNFWHA